MENIFKFRRLSMNFPARWSDHIILFLSQLADKTNHEQLQNNVTMSIFTKTVLFLLTSSFLCRSYGFNHLPNIEVVMRAGETIYGGEIRTYRNGYCKVRFPENGNFASDLAVYDSTSLAYKPWLGNQNSFCLGSTTETMSYTLQADGNFIAYCGSQLNYTTHMRQDEVGDYFMAIE